jgi:hypothetical protein
VSRNTLWVPAGGVAQESEVDAQNEIELLRRRVNELGAETLALQALAFGSLRILAQTGGGNHRVVTKTFDYAERVVEVAAIKFGKAAPPEYTLGAIKFIEQWRALALDED